MDKKIDEQNEIEILDLENEQTDKNQGSAQETITGVSVEDTEIDKLGQENDNIGNSNSSFSDFSSDNQGMKSFETTSNLLVQDGKSGNNDNKKKKIVISVLLFVLIFGISSVFCYIHYQEKKTENVQGEVDNKDKQQEDGNEEEDNKQSEEKPYSLRVYGYTFNNGNSFLLCGEKDSVSYCDEEAFVIPVETEDAKILAYAFDNYVLYRDDKIYLYNDDNEKSLEVSIDNDAQEYILNTSNEGYVYYVENKENKEQVVYGITFIKNEKATYYNLDTEKRLYGNKYSNISSIDGELLNGYKEDEEKAYLLDANKNKVYLSVDTVCGNFGKVYSGDSYYVFASLSCIGESVLSIYTSNYKLIAESVSGAFYEFGKNGHVFIGNDKDDTIKEYDITGKEVNSYGESADVLSVHEDLYIIKKNDAIYIKEYTGEEYKLMDWKDEYYYHSMLSRYYEKDELDNENEKEPGYYFIFEYGQFEEGPGIEFYFNPVSKELKSWDLEEIGGYAKPVLYLYPEEEIKVTVDFENEDSLTTTYPKFEDKWQVIASPNGDLKDKDGKYYYGLYWEEESNHRVDFRTGFYVTKDQAIDFLEEKLSFIGLNDRERNEFIMYWLPILEKNEQSLVYFELTEERESFNKLEIVPKPDSLLRVAIHVKKVDRKICIQEQKLVPFKRFGFSAVEWGGVLYNS